MQSSFRSLIWLFTTAVIVAASAVGCSSDEPDSPDANTEQAAQPIDPADPPSPDEQVLVGDKGFIKVGIGTSVDDVYPPGLDPSCVPPGPGDLVPGSPLPSSPPVPGYLPEGFALKKESHSRDGRHFADSYASASNSYRFKVFVWRCSRLSIPAEAHWELVTVAGHWGILFEGACFEGSDGGCDWDPNFARTLWFETDEGYVVEMSSLIVPLDKAELIKIAESLPVFDTQTGGSGATVNKP